MIRWLFFPRRLTPLQKAERASTLAAPTQAIGQVRARKRQATHAGLLASLAPEDRARVAAKLAPSTTGAS